MKNLQLNPDKYDIELFATEIEKETNYDYGSANVHFTFGEVNGNTIFLHDELEKIGNWFLKLSKEIKSKK